MERRGKVERHKGGAHACVHLPSFAGVFRTSFPQGEKRAKKNDGGEEEKKEKRAHPRSQPAAPRDFKPSVPSMNSVRARKQTVG